MPMEMRSPSPVGADPKDALLLQGWFSALFSRETREDEWASVCVSDRMRFFGGPPELRSERAWGQDS